MAARNRSTEELIKLIPLDLIQIVERPAKGKEHEQLFYNSRSPQSFTPESMAALQMSIRTDELLEALVVRIVDGVYQLLAGERRYRAILDLCEKNLACFNPKGKLPRSLKPGTVVMYMGTFAQVDKTSKGMVNLKLLDAQDRLTGEVIEEVSRDELYPTLPARQLYKNGVPAKVIENCSDERALRINMAENGQSQPLTTSEEVEVVERLIRMELKQERIAYVLSTNITWVSQTASFRRELPPEAFQKLVQGKMARNVAVNFLSYKPEDRAKLFESTVQAEEAETAEKIRQHQLEQEQAEDEAEILEDAADKADDPKVANQTRKKAATAKKKAKKAKDKKDKAEADSGTLKQGHVQKGAAQASVKPKKDKMLPRGDVAEIVEKVDELLAEKTIDPICEQKVEHHDLTLVKAVLQGVLSGERDPLAMIRTAKVSLGLWSIPDQLEDNEEAVDAPDEALYDEDYEDSEYDADAADEFDVYDEDYGDENMDDVDNWD